MHFSTRATVDQSFQDVGLQSLLTDFFLPIHRLTLPHCHSLLTATSRPLPYIVRKLHMTSCPVDGREKNMTPFIRSASILAPLLFFLSVCLECSTVRRFTLALQQPCVKVISDTQNYMLLFMCISSKPHGWHTAGWKGVWRHACAAFSHNLCGQCDDDLQHREWCCHVITASYRQTRTQTISL